LFTITKVTSLDKVFELAGPETTSGRRQLEGPEEVGSLLEVGSNSEDFVDQILDRNDTILAKALLDELVVGQGDALAVDLAVSALVDELADGLEVRLSVGDPWLDDAKHLKGGLGKAHKDTVVDLKETEELEDLTGLGGDLVDTLDTDDKDKLGLGRDVERAIFLGITRDADLLTLCFAVLLHVLFGTLEDDIALLFVLLLPGFSGRGTVLGRLFIGLALLEKSLRDENMLGCGD